MPFTALALELLDALRVVATPGWRSVRLALAASPGGALRVLELRTAVDAVPGAARPTLGIEPGAMFGVINEAVQDLAGLAAADGIAWRPGAIEVAWESDGGASLTLLDADAGPSSAAPRIAHRVAMDAAAVDAMLFTDALFAEIARTERELPALQQRLAERVLDHDAWHFDQDTATLVLRRSGLTRATLAAQAIGTHSDDADSWLWAWANESIDPLCARAVTAVRDAARAERGLSALWRPSLPSGEGFASVLAGIAALRMGARGVYRATFDTGVLYLAIDASPTP